MFKQLLMDEKKMRGIYYLYLVLLSLFLFWADWENLAKVIGRLIVLIAIPIFLYKAIKYFITSSAK